MRVLLDTNVLLRLTDANHPAHAPAEAAVERLHAAGMEAVLVPQILHEFWVVATRPIEVNGLGLSVPEAEAQAAEWEGLFRLLRDERSIYDRWRNLVVAHDVKGKTAHDARLVAAMERHSLAHLLTFNVADFARFPGLTVLSPEDVTTGRFGLGRNDRGS